MRLASHSLHRHSVRRMFSAITARYDRLNRLLSFGRDRAWRRRAVDAMAVPDQAHVLDLCCGTGDLAFELLARPAFRGRVVGADFCAEMLSHARAKAAVRRLDASRVRWIETEAERLPFPARSFDVVAMAFGLRNMADPEATLAEALRVTRRGGRLVVLELNTPPGRAFRALFRFYFTAIAPRVGAWISGDPCAYRYLPDSVSRFPEPAALAALVERSGWRACTYMPLTGGIATVHAAAAPA